jgi:hypothetical protein
MPLPLRTVNELETEALIGRYRILIVEGPSDSRYLQKWLSELGWQVVPVAVSDLDLSSIRLEPTSFENNRAKVAELASHFASSNHLRFLIDRDLGIEGIDLVDSLFVTDFPSLESYALTETVLRELLVHLDRVDFDSTQPDLRARQLSATVAGLIRKLAGYLCPLFRLRVCHARMDAPDAFVQDLRRFRRASSDELDVERIRLVLRIADAEDPDDGNSLPASCDDLRAAAYGHDIARSIWALWPDLRSRNGILDSDQLEGLLLSFVRVSELRKFPLFESIRQWAA